MTRDARIGLRWLIIGIAFASVAMLVLVGALVFGR